MMDDDNKLFDGGDSSAPGEEDELDEEMEGEEDEFADGEEEDEKEYYWSKAAGFPPLRVILVVAYGNEIAPAYVLLAAHPARPFSLPRRPRLFPFGRGTRDGRAHAGSRY